MLWAGPLYKRTGESAGSTHKRYSKGKGTGKPTRMQHCCLASDKLKRSEVSASCISDRFRIRHKRLRGPPELTLLSQRPIDCATAPSGLTAALSRASAGRQRARARRCPVPRPQPPGSLARCQGQALPPPHSGSPPPADISRRKRMKLAKASLSVKQYSNDFNGTLGPTNRGKIKAFCRQFVKSCPVLRQVKLAGPSQALSDLEDNRQSTEDGSCRTSEQPSERVTSDSRLRPGTSHRRQNLPRGLSRGARGSSPGILCATF
jgi:hypothetical protein